MINYIFPILIIAFTFFFSSFSTYANLNDDIKWNRWPTIDLNNYLLYQFIIIFLLVLILLYNKFYVNKKIIMKTTLDEKWKKVKTLTFALKKMKKNIENYSKSDFYHELNWFFREYFSILDVKNSDTLTLKELKQIILDKELMILFEKSYLNEFNDKRDLINTRLDIIDKLVNIIK